MSDEYVEKLGGLQTISAKGNGLDILKFDGGILLQACDLPQLDDVEQGIDIPAYSRVGEIIEPVRCHTYVGGMHIGSAPEPKFNAETFAKW